MYAVSTLRFVLQVCCPMLSGMNIGRLKIHHMCVCVHTYIHMYIVRTYIHAYITVHTYVHYHFYQAVIAILIHICFCSFAMSCPKLER